MKKESEHEEKLVAAIHQLFTLLVYCGEIDTDFVLESELQYVRDKLCIFLNEKEIRNNE